MATFTGNIFANQFIGTAQDDTFDLKGGDDQAYGQGGEDEMDGGNGNDVPSCLRRLPW